MEGEWRWVMTGLWVRDRLYNWLMNRTMGWMPDWAWMALDNTKEPSTHKGPLPWLLTG